MNEVRDITGFVTGIKQEENEFPKRFASYEEKEYGILFYMADNKDSYDGNHACIYPEKITDLGAVLDDISEFYKRLGMQASIYHPFEKDYFKDNIEILQAHGYTYTAEEDHRVMLLTEANNITTPKRLDIRVLNKWEERVATDILIPSGEPWEIEVTKKRAEQEGTYLFVGYLDDKAVVYSDIHKSEYGNTRFDYIVTAKEHRGHGYASELLSFMVEYCKKNAFPMCWQWAGPSEHICYNAGFREAFTMEGGYAANSYMPEQKIITDAMKYIEELFANDHSGHDAAHTMRVYHNALLLADTEPQCNRFVVSLAALLHDADDHKIFHTENNQNARAFLEKHQIDGMLMEEICEVINGVSFSKNRGIRPETTEGKIVQDADRLDAMGAIGIARTFAFGGERGRSIEDSVQHFYDKLLLLKDEMNTVAGKQMAKERHDFMEQFLVELKKEQ